MKTFLLLALSISLLSIATFAQTATPSTSPAPSPTSTQLDPSPTPSPVAVRNAPPDLPYMVEILACSVMLGSVIAVFVLVWRQQQMRGQSIGPRHIQFVSVCLIVPTILILGLEQVLSKETTATLIGGLTGFLLSGFGKYEPPKDGDEPPKAPDSASGGDPKNNQTKENEGPPMQLGSVGGRMGVYDQREVP